MIAISPVIRVIDLKLELTHALHTDHNNCRRTTGNYPRPMEYPLLLISQG